MGRGSNRGSEPLPRFEVDIVVADRDMTLYRGDALKVLRENLHDKSVAACVTSPPYLDARPEYDSPTLKEFYEIFVELRRVVIGPMLLNVGRLWRDGQESLWWVRMIEEALRAGWTFRDTLVWVKPNANPIHGEVLANSHEYVFIFGIGCVPNNVRTDYDAESLARFTRRYRNGGGVKGDVREQDSREANELGARARSFFIGYVGREKGNPHPAPMSLDFAKHLVALASYEGHEIIDPFAGSGTTLLAARLMGRESIGIERDERYCAIAADRLAQQTLEIA